MSDLISREKLWKRITSTYDEGLSLDELKSEIDEMPTVDAESLITQHEDIGYERGYRDGYAEALEVTDDVEPVKHGHWEAYNVTPYNFIRYICSECGAYTTVKGYQYCPRCGAKMDVPDTDVGKMEVKDE